MMRYLIPMLVFLASAAQAADDQKLVYTQPMGGVYVQDWSIKDAKYYAAGIRTVTVIGEGKAGDFQGQLYVDCPNAAQSKWLSVEDLYLNASAVPLEAIVGIRAVLCEDS